jgi:uncharacterized protein DUF3300
MKKFAIMIIANTVLVLAAVVLIVKSGVLPGSTHSTPAARTVQSAPSGQAATKPTSIDDLVAPIALYPDQLLAQMLMCASSPDDVRRLNEWLKVNQSLKGTELQDAALLANFEPSFVALAVFPQVVSKMAANIEKTTLLGQVFAADRNAVFASIQKLRAQAKNVGTLKSTPQQQVETKTTSAGEDVIVIEPTNPQVVYVPQYNPTVVYQTAPTTTTQTIIIKEEDNTDEAVAAGLIGFTAGIAIGAAVNNSYYYGPYGWHGGGYMYNDAWDDYYDHREDAREDWQDHREDLSENRGDRAGTAQEQRTERQQNRTENRPETQAAADQRRSDAKTQAQQRQASGQTAGAQAQTAGTTGTQRSAREGSYESRGHSGSQTRTTADRSGTKSDAFSGYSSSRSTSAASSRGSASRGSSRSRGGGGRRR